MTRVVAALALFVLAGCATQTPTWWDAEQISHSSYANTRLQAQDGKSVVTTVSVGDVRAMVETARQIEKQAGVTAHVYLIEGTDPNAFSYAKDAQNYVAVNLAMYWMIQSDADMWAALLGHEYAHLALHHGQARVEREEVRSGASQLLGAVLSLAGVPMGGTVANVATTAVATTYTRDEERDADRYGMEYAKHAGFSPYGAVRLWERMEERSTGPNPLAFLSTHPQSAERLETMKKLAAGMQ